MKTIFKQFCILAGLTLPALAIGGMMNLFSGFSVEREVLIDPQHIHEPLALLRAADGGYFVLEKGYGNGIVKTDSYGQTQWTYREPDPGIRSHRPGSAVEFTSAAAAPDGGVVLGGHRARASEHYVDAFAGVLVRLDKDGHVVGRVAPGLQHNQRQTDLFDVYAVSRWGDGFGAIGSANHKQVVLRLRNDGSSIWQKELITRGAIESLRTEARALPDGDLAIQGLDNFVRIDADGRTLQEVELDASCHWLTYVEPTEENSFLCNANSDNASIVPEMVEVKVGDESVLRLPWPKFKKTVGTIGISRIYGMEGGRYVLFGASSNNLFPFIPVIIEINNDQSVIAKKEFIGVKEDGIADGMPTSVPHEYVVIRPVIHEKAGTAMTFIRRN